MSVINLAEYSYKLTLDNSEYTNNMQAAAVQAEGMKSKLSGVGDFLKTSLAAGIAAAGVAIVGTVVKSVQSADELKQAMNGFQAATGIATESLGGYDQALKNIYAGNYGESFEDIADAMKTVTQNANDIDPSNIEQLTKNALSLRDTFDFDVSESMRSVNTLMDQFGVSGEEAFNLIAQGAQNGLDYSGEMLDSINEYSVQFAKVGLSADDMFNVMANGAESGAFNLDKIGDAVKEFSIRAIDGSKTTVDAYKQLGLNADEMASKFAAGGDTAKEAFSETMKAISSISDPVKQNTVGVELFGTQWEDLGTEAVLALSNTNGQISKTKDAMDAINSIKYNSFGEAMQGIGRQLEVGLLVPIGEKILPVLNTFANWLNSNLPTAIDTAKNVLGGIAAFFDPLINAVKTVISTFQETEGQTNTSFTAIQGVIKSVTDTIKSIIDVFVTAFTVIWDKWGADIVSFAQTYFNNIMTVIQTALDLIQGIAQLFIDIFTGNWKGVFEDIKNIASTAWDLVKAIFKTAIDNVNAVVEAGFTLLDTIISGLMDAVWTGIKNVWANIVAWFDETINGDKGLVAWFGGQEGTFNQIGFNLLNWVWDGMKSIFKNISTWVSEKVDWLADKLAFWRSATEEISRGGGFGGSRGGGIAINGSHANGLSYVPFDGYVGLLHKGERVLTAKENAVYSSYNQSKPTFNYTGGDIIIQGHADQNTVNQIKGALKEGMSSFLTSMEQYSYTHRR